ncbi:MAG: NADH:ubiquinone reductase (Na(+)-transporting) subunit C, partial [Bacteroidales bacterium]
NVLKPYQLKNLEIAKKLEILRSVDKAWDLAADQSKNQFVEGEYEKFITASLVVGPEGDTVAGTDAFLIEPVKELKKDAAQRVYPVFICTHEDGSENFIFPVNGKGLWGPIWGYVALEPDLNTISGVFFDHKGETPGLGSEINTREFQQQFIKLKLFDDGGQFIGIKVNKATEPRIEFHTVDAISGGTITSKGLQETIYESMIYYLPFIKKAKQ